MSWLGEFLDGAEPVRWWHIALPCALFITIIGLALYGLAELVR